MGDINLILNLYLKIVNALGNVIRNTITGTCIYIYGTIL